MLSRTRGVQSGGTNLVSIIIPTLNEETEIGEVISRCLALRPEPEVVICDGGSSDQTVPIAIATGVRVVRSPRRGRSFQMNEAARAVSGDVLVFLHADSRIGQEAWDALHLALENMTVCFGAFRRRFCPPSWLLNLGSYLAVWRGKISHIFLGDQAIFVRAECFNNSGGYREILLFEDVDLCLRLREMGKGTMLPVSITTSSRRFQAEGDWRRLYRNMRLWLKYWFGTNPDELARVYYPGYYSSPTPSAGAMASQNFGPEEKRK